MKGSFSKKNGGVLLVIAMFPFATTGQFTIVRNADDRLTIAGYTGFGGNVEIPSAVNGFAVTSIGEYAFQGVSTITSLRFPDSVTSIEHNVFAYCTSLTRVTIGSGTTTIGINAFYGKEMEEDIECNAGFQDIRMETEAGIDPS